MQGFDVTDATAGLHSSSPVTHTCDMLVKEPEVTRGHLNFCRIMGR